MPIYQIKIRGRKGPYSQETFLQWDVEETINMVLAEEGRSKKELGDKFEEREIEEVKLLFDVEDPDKAVAQIYKELAEAFRDLQHLGQIGVTFVEGQKPDAMELWSFMRSIDERIEQIYSLLDAYNDITLNKKWYFEKKSALVEEKAN